MTDTPTTDLVSVAPRSGETHTYRMDAPLPGTYWRLRESIEAGINTHRMVVPAMAAGTVLMLARVDLADGQPHVYGFAPHPNWSTAKKVEFHADDFHRHWEPCPEGPAVRAAELQGLLEEMEQTKALMMQPPPGAAPAALLAHDPTADVGETGRELATIDQVNAIALHAERLKESAELQSEWITKHSKALSAQGGRLANFHQERAQAGLARAKAQLDGVAGLLKTVANLRIYTGDGIELLMLRDGAPAAADNPVTFYQEVLSLDEEAMILLDQGGLDHTETESLMEALRDPALLTRLIPAERGAVLARFRSTYKEFVKEAGDAGQTIAARRLNHELTDESKRKRLLVRDGERLYLVDADDILQPIDQLLPSALEQADHFTRKARWYREEPTRITRDDLDYAQAQRNQLGALDHYGQVLILLWGMRDRGVLFADSALPRFTNWLDPSFQDRYLRLVSVDNMLTVTRPSYAQWAKEQNAYLSSGSWVALQARSITIETCPGAFTAISYSGGRAHYDRIYQPRMSASDNGVFIARVRSSKDGLFIEIPADYCGYNPNVIRREVTLRVSLLEGKPKQPIDGLLVLDRVRASDLMYYLESRQQRRSYEQYVTLFQGARRWVAARDAAEEPTRAALAQAVKDAALPHDPDSLEDRMTDALAVARTSRRDGVVPSLGTPAHAAYVRTALDALHAGVSNHQSRIQALDRWAADNGRELLRFAKSGKAGWVLYLVPTHAEHDARLGRMRHATVASVDFTGDAVAVSILGRRMLRAVAEEQVIHDWNREIPAPKNERHGFIDEDQARTVTVGAVTWLKYEPPFKLSYQDAVEALDKVWAVGNQMHSETIDLRRLVEDARDYMRHASKRSVIRMYRSVPVGTLLYRGKPMVAYCNIDAICHAYALGDDQVRTLTRQVVLGIYANKDYALTSLEGVDDIFTKVSLDDFAISQRRGTAIVHGGTIGQACCTPVGKKPRTDDVTITSVTPAAAERAPWLSAMLWDAESLNKLASG